MGRPQTPFSYHRRWQSQCDRSHSCKFPDLELLKLQLAVHEQGSILLVAAMCMLSPFAAFASGSQAVLPEVELSCLVYPLDGDHRQLLGS